MASAPDQDPRVDDLRQRLRALGYLDAGVDRFVLASARDARAPWIIALFASLRIGGLAAILLGPASAIGLAARLPSLVTGPRDALFMAIYFAIFFGVAMAAAALVLSLLVSWTPVRTDVLVHSPCTVAVAAGRCLGDARLPRLPDALGANRHRGCRLVRACVDGFRPGLCGRHQSAAWACRHGRLVGRRDGTCAACRHAPRTLVAAAIACGTMEYPFRHWPRRLRWCRLALDVGRSTQCGNRESTNTNGRP